jgi:hypothetical protein
MTLAVSYPEAWSRHHETFERGAADGRPRTETRDVFERQAFTVR